MQLQNYDVALVVLALLAFGGLLNLSKSGYIFLNSGTSSAVFLQVSKTENKITSY